MGCAAAPMPGFKSRIEGAATHMYSRAQRILYWMERMPFGARRMLLSESRMPSSNERTLWWAASIPARRRHCYVSVPRILGRNSSFLYLSESKIFDFVKREFFWTPDIQRIIDHQDACQSQRISRSMCRRVAHPNSDWTCTYRAALDCRHAATGRRLRR